MCCAQRVRMRRLFLPLSGLSARSLKGQLVRAVLVGVVGMSGCAFPLNLVLLRELIELIPKILVQDGLAIAPDPVVRLPSGDECGNPLLQILRVTYQSDAA